MKKILLLSAVLLGAVSASQAGIHLNIGLPLPPLPLPRIVIGRPAPVYAAPVYSAPDYYSTPAVVIEPPSFYVGVGPRYYDRGCAPRYYNRGYYPRNYSRDCYPRYNDYSHYRGGWDRHHGRR